MQKPIPPPMRRVLHGPWVVRELPAVHADVAVHVDYVWQQRDRILDETNAERFRKYEEKLGD